MDITNFKTIIIECDGILINHYQGILNKIYELQQNLPQNIPFKKSLIRDYMEHYHNKSDSLTDNGFCALHCFTFQALMEQNQISFNWKRTFQFGRAMKHWPLYEDAYGALHYLKKFFKILIRCDREPEDIPYIINDLDIQSNDLIIRNDKEDGLIDELKFREIDVSSCLLITTPDIAKTNPFPNTKIIHRNQFKQNSDSHGDTLASLVVEHQNAIRNSWH
ncbi:hypothetical protein [Vibrio salinus]|uniref:hypothetical protein n=1 Tax=Vibrio salinus TaxID=2899784 RepID=UPI001E2BD542|nr:hypothetical protein [Vibrio salinus]MCE0494968.1 hypothetical protein [Vibrio salinus]